MLAKISALRWDIALLFCVSIELARRASRLLKARFFSLTAR